MAVDKRVVILCEGPSDEAILKVLFQKDRLNHIAPWIQPLNGVTRFREKEIKSRVCNCLKMPGVLAVFALIDLKGSETIVNYPSDITSYVEKARLAKEHLKKFLSGLPESDRFYPHVAVHDIEAWILADKAAVTNYFGSSTLPYRADLPEAIDFDKSPSHLLEDFFIENKGHRYRKTVHASELFLAVNFDTVYNKCPHFRDFFDDLIKVTTQEVINGQD